MTPPIIDDHGEHLVTGCWHPVAPASTLIPLHKRLRVWIGSKRIHVYRRPHPETVGMDHDTTRRHCVQHEAASK